MPGIEAILDHVVPFLLVVMRMAGLFVFAPLIASPIFNTKFRVLLAVMMSLALYPTLPTSAQVPPDVDLFMLVPLAFSEIMIGLAIGLMSLMPLIAMEIAGMLMGYQMGLTLARAFNPEAQTQGNILGRFLFFIALAAFLDLGGLEVLFLSLAETFEHVPAGAFSVDQTPVVLFVGIVTSGYEIALRVASPVACVIMLQTISMGFIMKTMPQVNILSVGFALKIVSGIVMLAASVLVIDELAYEHIAHVLGLIMEWSESL